MKNACLAAVLATACMAAAAAPRYAVTVFDEGIEAQALNSKGAVLLNSWMPGRGRKAALFDGGKLTWLGNLGGRNTVAKAFNDDQVVVGQAQLGGDNDAWHAFVYKNGTMVDIDGLGSLESEALGINNAGQVIGNAHFEDGTSRCFLYTAAGGMVDIGTLGGASCQVAAIGESGEILGSAEGRHGEWAGFLYRDGVMRQFPPGRSYPRGFGSDGQIWTLDGERTTVERGDLALAPAVGALLRAAGRYAIGRDAEGRFEVLQVDGRDVYRLDDLAGEVWGVYRATDVNRLGQVVARGCTGPQVESCRAILLTPTAR